MLNERLKKWGPLCLLALITVIGAYFRLIRLGEVSMRGDTMEIWKVCKMDLSAFEIWRDIRKVAGQGFMPFQMAYTRAFLDIFHLPLTFFTIRLTAAIWGIISIPVMYAAGRLLGGVKFGLVTALLLALHPFHIQCSREVFAYVFACAGTGFALWAMLWLIDYLKGKTNLKPMFYVAVALGLLFLLHVQPNSWPLAGFFGIFVFGATFYRAIRSPRKYYPLLITSITMLIIGLPVVFSEWGLALHTPGAIKGMAPSKHTVSLLDTDNFAFIYNFAWGNTWPRILFTLTVLFLGVCVFISRWKERKYLLVAGLFVVGMAVTWGLLLAVSSLITSRYLVFLFPFYLLILVSGLICFTDLPFIKKYKQSLFPRILSGVFICVAVIFLVYPAHLSTRLTGKPTPYYDIVKWSDSNLPQGTPILVDNWLIPWNQLRIHPATNVFFVYTVPNVPQENYLKYKWRDTAKNFFGKYKDAAYLEVLKQYWNDPGIGPWHWPRQHFARHVAITNEACLKLVDLGLNYRGRSRKHVSQSYTNSIIVELFYNLPEDVVEQAKNMGEESLVMYGEGWGYTKTRDFRDWRILKDTATLDLYNLTDKPQDVKLKIEAVAIQQAKQVKFMPGQLYVFPPDKLTTFEIGPISLRSGRNKVSLTDPLWGKRNIPLLVEGVSIID
ncbi:hypothetical protein ACFLS1_03010 [Verrucomicrobiota bacterium]